MHPRGTIITLDSRVNWNHWGEQFGIPDGFGGFIDERAEVALLSRNIMITGQDEPAPNQLEGGHFIVVQTAVPQFIEGVEFWQMGQQGNLGRYNIHFHVCGDTQGKSVVRKNSMHDSKQVRARATPWRCSSAASTEGKGKGSSRAPASARGHSRQGMACWLCGLCSAALWCTRRTT